MSTYSTRSRAEFLSRMKTISIFLGSSGALSACGGLGTSLNNQSGARTLSNNMIRLPTVTSSEVVTDPVLMQNMKKAGVASFSYQGKESFHPESLTNPCGLVAVRNQPLTNCTQTPQPTIDGIPVIYTAHVTTVFPTGTLLIGSGAPVIAGAYGAQVGPGYRYDSLVLDCAESTHDLANDAPEIANHIRELAASYTPLVVSAAGASFAGEITAEVFIGILIAELTPAAFLALLALAGLLLIEFVKVVIDCVSQ